MRKFIIGVDGGGTKTIAVLSDLEGNIVCSDKTSGINYQIIGIDTASETITKLIRNLLKRAKIGSEEISFLLLGLAGTDFPEEIQLWENHLAPDISCIPHKICTDTWVALAAGSLGQAGAISICGTGHNTAVKREDGEEFVISALRFALGNFGGGRMIADFALHSAFRDFEDVGEKTLLTKYLPEFCEVEDMVQLRTMVLDSGYTYHYKYPVPKLVAELAQKGDRVSFDILRKIGKVQGEMTARLIRKAGMEKENIPIVLAGSVYCGEDNAVIVDSFKSVIREMCPELKPNYVTLECPPVFGSLLLAARQTIEEEKNDIFWSIFKENLTKTFEVFQ